jgi:hypothetical protein
LKELGGFIYFNVNWGQACNNTEGFISDRATGFSDPNIYKSLDPGKFYIVAGLCKCIYPYRSTIEEKMQYGFWAS